MIEAFKLVGKIALEGGEKVEKGLGKIKKTTEEVGGKFKNAGKGVSEAGKKMGVLSGVVAGAGAGIMALASKTGDYADRILDLNAITGMSTDAIQEWSYVAGIAGVSSEAVTKASQMLTKNFDQMREGTGRGAKALETLGIQFETLENASPDERMNILTKALQGVEDPSRRAELATQLFKGGAEDLLPILSMTEEQIAGAKKEAGEMGTVMSGDALNNANDYRIGMEKLQRQFEGIGQQLVANFLPIIQEDLIPLIEKAVKFVKEWSDKFAELDEDTKKTIVVIGLVVASIAPLLLIIGGAISLFGTLITVGGVLATVIGAISLPVVLVVAGIVALIAIGVLLYKNWDVIKKKARELWTKVKEDFQKLKKSITEPIEDAKKKVETAVGKIIDFFKGIGEKAKIKIPTPKLPKMNWTGKFSVLPPSVPKLNIDWFETGGIFDGASVIGVGENGREAVINLENERYFEPFARAIASNMGNNTTLDGMTVEVPVNLNGKTIARVIAPLINNEIERYRKTKERGV